MAGGEQGDGLDWQGGTLPVSRRFNDPYFSLNDGLDETRHVFLTGNTLPARFHDGFHIAELGFGTGLNLLATLLTAGDHALHFTSFEAYPLSAPDIARALKAFPDALAVADPFLLAWSQGQRRFTLGRMKVDIIIGDARDTLPLWPGQADAWYLDGFSPAKNPEMWSNDLMLQVGLHTAPFGTCATYTAAGHVRRALTAAGFHIERVQGHGTKRHMTRGYKP